MPRWDVLIFCVPQKQYFRVGFVDAETEEDAKRKYAEMFKTYLRANSRNKSTSGEDIPLLDSKKAGAG